MYIYIYIIYHWIADIVVLVQDGDSFFTPVLRQNY